MVKEPLIIIIKGKRALSKEEYLKSLLDKAKKPNGTTDVEWEDMDMKAAGTIELYLMDHFMYYMIGETSVVGLGLKLESLYDQQFV